MTQQELDRLLDTNFTIPVEIRTATFPNNTPYPQLNNIDQTGLEITARELLHAIGSKTAALPANYQDDCIHSAFKFLHLLDFEGENLGYKATINLGSDLQTNTSNEIGVGVGCLVASKLFNVDWDTLEAVAGRGVRFDYRATNPGQNYVYEFKGTKHRRNQIRDIASGLSKKETMHNRNEQYDVELIVSTHFGNSNEPPRIILADPPFEGFQNEFTEEAGIVYRLRHLARIAQFIGDTKLSRVLYMQSREFITKKDDSQIQELGETLQRRVIKSSEPQKLLEKTTAIKIDNKNFIGQWVSSLQPEGKTNKGKIIKLPKFADKGKVEIFQGASIDLYKTMTETSLSDLKQNLKYDREKIKANNNIEYTTFGDGTVMGFRII